MMTKELVTTYILYSNASQRWFDEDDQSLCPVRRPMAACGVEIKASEREAWEDLRSFEVAVSLSRLRLSPPDFDEHCRVYTFKTLIYPC